MHAVVHRIVRASTDSEDVVEAAFWQAWREASRYESSRGEVRAWLCTIARSRALDYVRSAGRLREEPLVDRDRNQLSIVAKDNPAMDAESAERRAVVIAALNGLPADQREAVQLGYFDGLSQSEIALHLNLPLGTVKTRVRLALRKLRSALHILRENVLDGRMTSELVGGTTSPAPPVA